MEHSVKLNETIDRLTIPYKNIFTTVYLVRCGRENILFDAASYDSDIDEYVLPWLKELRVTELRYVFISHNHTDHAGGLGRLMAAFPDAVIVSRSKELREKFKDCRFLFPEDGDVLTGTLQIVTLRGHSMDSMTLYDKQSKIMLTGDGLQLLGIFGADFWGANISYPVCHLQALEKLRRMEVEELLWAHDYHPMGRGAKGEKAVFDAIDACAAPLLQVRNLIAEHPELDDEAIRSLYNVPGIPMMGCHVVTAVRRAMQQGEL